MFDCDMSIKGKHARYWKELSDTPGNARDAGNNFKIFLIMKFQQYMDNAIF